MRRLQQLCDCSRLTADEIGSMYLQSRVGHFDPPGAEPRTKPVERVAAALQDDLVPAGNVPVAPASLTVVEVAPGGLVQAKLQNYNLAPSHTAVQVRLSRYGRKQGEALRPGMLMKES